MEQPEPVTAVLTFSMSGTNDADVLREVDASSGYPFGTLIRLAVAAVANLDMRSVQLVSGFDSFNASKASSFNASDPVNALDVTAATFRRRALGGREAALRGLQSNASSACQPGSSVESMDASVQLTFSPAFLASQGLAGQDMPVVLTHVKGLVTSLVADMFSGRSTHPAVALLLAALAACTSVYPTIALTSVTDPVVVGGPPAQQEQGLRLDLIVGLTVGLGVPCCAFLALGALCRRRKRKQAQDAQVASKGPSDPAPKASALPSGGKVSTEPDAEDPSA